MNNYSDNDIIKLIYQSLTDGLNAVQMEQLNDWLNADSKRRQWYEKLERTDLFNTALTQQTPDRVNAIVQELYVRIQAATGVTAPLPDINIATSRPVHRVHFLRTGWFRYAAAILILVSGIGFYFLFADKRTELPLANGNKSLQTDIAPGTNRAVLTVGNKTIDLATDKTGIAVGSVVAYNDGEKIADAGQLLQLATPRGGQYQAVLPDGSKVWLNAASGIRFPSKFTGETREVEITGEAYLEIAKNSKQPFYVHTKKMTVQVLGTSFNVNAYEDEGVIKTTLAEGSVKVSRGASEVILKPGQQAVAVFSDQQLLNTKGVSIVANPNLDQVLAWKNGIFDFNGADLKTMMRQLARWYDIEVEFVGAVKPVEFNGELTRDLNLSQVLNILKDLGIDFKMKGRKLIVMS